MQIQRPIKLYVPLTAINIIDNNIKRNHESYYYIIDHIIRKMICNKNKKESDQNYVPLNFKKIRDVINKNPSTYIKSLKKYEIIKSDGIFEIGKKRLHYKINSKIMTEVGFVEMKPESKIYNKFLKNYKNDKTNFSKLKPHLHKMSKKIMNFEYDYEAAKKWIENNEKDPYKKIMSYYSLEQIKDKRKRYFKRCKTNKRLNTPLTNLKKELRQFIINKKQLVSIDLKNSQPFFLIILIEKIMQEEKQTTHQINKNKNQNNKITIYPYCDEINFSRISKTFGISLFREVSIIRKKYNSSFFTNFSDYKELVKKGIFYDEFVKIFDGQYTRDKIKHIMFCVLFSKNYYYKNSNYSPYQYNNKIVPFEKEKEIFAKAFPVIYDIIYALKKKNNHDLAICLQKMESETFIDKICSRLVDENIIPYTIHDSVIVEKNNAERTLQIIKEVFLESFGVIPKFDVELLSQNADNNKKTNKTFKKAFELFRLHSDSKKINNQESRDA